MLKFCEDGNHFWPRNNPGANYRTSGVVIYDICNNCPATRVRQEQLIRVEDDGAYYDVCITIVDNKQTWVHTFEHFVPNNSSPPRDIMEGLN